MVFQSGDVVRLKSGGPVMTMDFIDASEQASCSFLDGQIRVRESFPPSLLKKVDRKELESIENVTA